MRRLLDAGLPAAHADARGCTPLHVSCCCDMAGMLWRAGAHVGAVCRAGATPLHWAAGAGRMCALFTQPHSPHNLSMQGVMSNCVL